MRLKAGGRVGNAAALLLCAVVWSACSKTEEGTAPVPIDSQSGSAVDSEDGPPSTVAATGEATDPASDSETWAASDLDIDAGRDTADLAMDSETGTDTGRNGTDSVRDSDAANESDPSDTAPDTDMAADSETGSSGGNDTAEAPPTDLGTDPQGDTESRDTGCPTYVAGLANCAFDLSEGSDGCPATTCRDYPCHHDGECPAGAGLYCVAGNCVDCWQDSRCGPGQICRTGRCVAPSPGECPAAVDCSSTGCSLISLSEAGCPVCVCGTPNAVLESAVPCSKDEDCLVLSSFPYRHCVYGRCAECRTSQECGGTTCIPPGFCRRTEPHVSDIYGSWLVGWSGGMDHYSYFRFEPDGTLRRAAYAATGALYDDVPPIACPDIGDRSVPRIGTWAVALDEAARAVIEITINIPCEDDDGQAATWVVTDLSENGMSARFGDYNATRVPSEQCAEDFSECEPPF